MAEMKQFGIDLELDDTIAQGNYSNLAIKIEIPTPSPASETGPKMGEA